jgi:hypothetical protein
MTPAPAAAKRCGKNSGEQQVPGRRFGHNGAWNRAERCAAAGISKSLFPHGEVIIHYPIGCRVIWDVVGGVKIVAPNYIVGCIDKLIVVVIAGYGVRCAARQNCQGERDQSIDERT